MLSRNSLAALAILSCLPVLGHAQQCATGYTAVSVTGRVSTLNLSPTRQAGQLCLTATAADGREVFDNCGALVGKITSQNPETGTSTIDHTALFDLNESFQTVGDVGQVTGILETDADGIPCAMSVTEHITTLKWGTGSFNGATMDVVSNGSISFCPGKNLNTLQLSGQGCLRVRRR